MKTALPHLAILLATVLWASSFATGKMAVLAMTTSQILFMRFCLGALILYAVIRLTRRRGGPAEINRQAFLSGMLAPGAATLLAYWGMIHTTAINAVVIFAWLPLVTSLCAWWLIAEKPSRNVLIGSGIALSGTLLLVSDDLIAGSSSLFGDFLCFLNLITVGFGQTILRRIARDHGNPMSVTIWQLLGAAAACLAVLVFFESWLDTRGVMEVPSLEVWLLILYLALFVSAGTFALNNYGLRYIAVGQTSLYYVLMAPLGVPFSYFLLDETITTTDLLAIGLVTAGVATPTAIRAYGRFRERSRSPI
ncbi:MAG: DMT family transporter [Proteobacteria bacterium]|nr:DMT family transporter [Pseudomonadota bacterium]